MEIVFFAALLIVPVLSVIALLMAIANAKRIKSLKSLVVKLVDSNGSANRYEAIQSFLVDEM